VELTILMPCLNEAETVERCVVKARKFLEANAVDGEVLVADNGSTDGSQQLAERAGARVVDVDERGYGSAIRAGTSAAYGRYVIMGDADDSYDFSALRPFLDQLREGADLVMGNRFQGGIAPGAMPALHQYLGNPVLSFIGRLLFKTHIGDFHCGLRGFSRDKILRLRLRTSGMEHASEIVVRATLARFRVVEVPTTLSPDGRSRPPHLRSWRDGWRHLRFLLMYSPRWLFLVPGVLVGAIGLVLGSALVVGPVQIFDVVLDVDTLVACAAAVTAGLQAVCFALFVKVYAIGEGLLPPDPRLRRFLDHATLERGLATGITVVLAGMVGAGAALLHWKVAGFGALDPRQELRFVVPSVTAIAVGSQLVLGSLLISILQIRHTSTTPSASEVDGGDGPTVRDPNSRPYATDSAQA